MNIYVYIYIFIPKEYHFLSVNHLLIITLVTVLYLDKHVRVLLFQTFHCHLDLLLLRTCNIENEICCP